MLHDTSTSLDLSRPRTVSQILGTSLRLYARYPLLFLLLALIVVGPYDLLVLLSAHTSPFGEARAPATTLFILTLIQFALINPFVSALQVQAVERLGHGEVPGLLDTLSRGVRVLPVVAAAEIIAGLGIGIGLILFILPGLILAIRWAVVAQVAALEGTDWPGALRRSARLASRNYLRIFAVLVVVSLIDLGLTQIGAAAAGTGRAAAQVALGIAITVLTRSFDALAVAILYFDLRARADAVPPPPSAP